MGWLPLGRFICWGCGELRWHHHCVGSQQAGRSPDQEHWQQTGVRHEEGTVRGTKPDPVWCVQVIYHNQCLVCMWCLLSVQNVRVQALQLDLGLWMILTPGEQMEKGQALRDAPILLGGYCFQQRGGILTVLLLLLLLPLSYWSPFHDQCLQFIFPRSGCSFED